MMEDHAHFSPKDLISASWTAKIHLKNFILLLILFYFIFFQSISTSQNKYVNSVKTIYRDKSLSNPPNQEEKNNFDDKILK